MAGQPFKWAAAGGLQAVVHLGGLLGHVNVDGYIAEIVGEFGNGLWPRRAQGVNRHTGIDQRPPRRRHALVQRAHRCRIRGKAALLRAQLGLRETRAFVQHGQHGQADAYLCRRIGQGPAQRQRVSIGLAVVLVLKVVELADLM